MGEGTAASEGPSSLTVQCGDLQASISLAKWTVNLSGGGGKGSQAALAFSHDCSTAPLRKRSPPLEIVGALSGSLHPLDPLLTTAPPAQLCLQLCNRLLLSLCLLLLLLIFLLPLLGSQLQIHGGSVLNGLCPGEENEEMRPPLRLTRP